MSDVKHTPGPWVYRPHQFDDWGYVRAQKHDDGFYSFICQAKDPRVTEDDENAARKNMVDPWEANARLIAAAPELLEALERCQRVIANMISGKGTPAGAEIINHWAQCVESEAQARDAIAKAKGEA